MRRLYTTFVLSPCVAVTLAACSGNPAVVRPGDEVAIGFTCRLADGTLAATTLPDGAVAAERKSPLYLPRLGPETVEVTAGPQPADLPKPKVSSFEQEIMQRLAVTLPGLREGERAVRTVTAERTSGMPEREQTVRLSLVRKRAREMRLTREEFMARTGKEPEVGARFIIDPLVPGKVSEVRENEVVVRFGAEPGKRVETPYGPATIRELPDRYEIVIEPEKGRLIRTGGMAGRITEIGSEQFTIDYGHPFAGENISCHVDVDEVKTRPASSLREADHQQVPVKQAPPVPAVDTAAASAALLKDALSFEKGSNAEGESGCKTCGSDKASAARAVAGDLASVDYTATLEEDGALFFTTRREVADDASVKKVSWFTPPARYGAETVTVGKNALLPGIGEALAGMTVGEKKRLTLPPEKGFGFLDPQKRVLIPLTRTLPRVAILAAEEYVKQTGSFPVVGQEMQLTPYFPARVSAVREREVELRFLAEDGKTYDEPFGSTTVKIVGEEIVTTLTPRIGARFPLPEGEGVIVSSDGTQVTVDQNHPLAGKTIVIDLELTDLTGAVFLPTGDLPWQEDHDASLAAARQAGKPALLVLHADWCSFCKKLFSETTPDPRITSLRDKFAWLRVNSDKLTEYKKRYGQDGYPMIVLFRSDGTIAFKQEGYLDAAQLSSIMQGVL